MSETNKGNAKLPEIGPYALPLVLAVMGVWCFYDGWISVDPDMQEHVNFNRIASSVLLIGALYSFIRSRRSAKREKKKAADNSIHAERDN